MQMRWKDSHNCITFCITKTYPDHDDPCCNASVQSVGRALSMHLEESTSDGVPLLALDVATARSIEGSSAGLDLPGTTEVLALRLDRTARQRRVIGLAGPVIGENLLETMLGIIDTVLVAGLG